MKKGTILNAKTMTC